MAQKRTSSAQKIIEGQGVLGGRSSDTTQNLNIIPSSVSESGSAEIIRLCKEIADRQARLQYLVCGDPRVGVSGIFTP